MEQFIRRKRKMDFIFLTSCVIRLVNLNTELLVMYRLSNLYIKETHHPLLALTIIGLTTVRVYHYWFACHLQIR